MPDKSLRHTSERLRWKRENKDGQTESAHSTPSNQKDNQLTVDKNNLRLKLLDSFPRKRDQLLPCLHLIQHELGYLPEWALEVVSTHVMVPESEVYGAATSYTELRVLKPGKHVLRVCTGLSCSINGGDDLAAAVSEELQIPPGETTPDGSITFEESPCFYICALGPSLELDGKWTGRATRETVMSVISKARRS